ncbi:MAG: Helix-turn-helix domain protein [Syntrophorhabdus sp. PtaU1.Bin153]|nr:MAG: Helix-turn-helix domain protein [Syntrophorhabdus sp. PtaU1.Bin153]
MYTLMSLIGSNIKRMREAKGWNQAKLAAKVEKPAARISELENNESSNPRLDTLQLVAYALGCELWELFIPEQSKMHLIGPEYYEIYEFLKQHDINSLAVLQHVIALDNDELDALLLYRDAKEAGITDQIKAITRYEIKRKSKQSDSPANPTSEPSEKIKS